MFFSTAFAVIALLAGSNLVSGAPATSAVSAPESPHDAVLEERQWWRTRTRTPTRPTTTSASRSTSFSKSPGSPSSSSAVIKPPQGTSAPSKGLTLGSTILYDLDNVGIGAPIMTSSKGVKVNAGVYIVDMAGHSAAQIKSYKDQGKTVICYFSAGTLEPFRDDLENFDPACACGPGGTLDSANECAGGSGDTKMDGWNEFWLDIHSAQCKTNVHEAMTKRIQAAKAKGCDGMDPDNVDSYSNGAPHGNTEADQVEYLLWLADIIHKEGMLVNLKNANGLIQSDAGPNLVNAFDFSVIESCDVYNECDTYDPFLDAGKPQIQIEYSNRIKTCPKLKDGQNLAVYSGDVLNSQDITLYCPNPGSA